jgi:hypothetical protein
MILYKYVSLAAGIEILRTNTIGFSQPKYFNDPFDKPTFPFGEMCSEVANPTDGLPILGAFDLALMGGTWSEDAAILCLTRTPINPLMWAHYAQSHTGVVLGIDMIKAVLTDEESNVIPAQFGSVIYLSERPEYGFIGPHLASGRSKKELMTELKEGEALRPQFDVREYEKLQRLFLYKPICWAYEEEVRVIKCVRDITLEHSESHGSLKVEERSGRPLYLLSLPKGAIRQVYFGIRSEHAARIEVYEHAATRDVAIRFFTCHSLRSEGLGIVIRDFDAQLAVRRK